MSYPLRYSETKKSVPMHTTEQRNSFLLLRGNGWSLRKISAKLNIPKSTLFNWECLHRAQIDLLKSMRGERLQQISSPKYKEDLQRVSSFIARLELALQRRAFDHMSPAFLLQTVLHLRSRLHKLRSQVQPIGPIPKDVLDLLHSAELDALAGSPPAIESARISLSTIQANSTRENGTFPDDFDRGATFALSPSSTSDPKNHTVSNLPTPLDTAEVRST
jgi:hypothetical protein